MSDLILDTELAQRWGFQTVRPIRKAARQGKIPYIRTGESLRRWGFTHTSVHQLMEVLQCHSSSQEISAKVHIGTSADRDWETLV